MPRGNSSSDTLDELPAKLMLIVDAVNKGNEETHSLLRNLINHIKENDKVGYETNEKIITAITLQSNEVSKAVKDGIQEIDLQNKLKSKEKTDISRIKQTISDLWQNTLNTILQAFWQYYKARRTLEIFENLLTKDPPQMPKKFLPKEIENESEEETELRKQLAVEKFKSEIALLKFRSQKYNQRFSELDAKMITHFTTSFDNDKCDCLTEEWENDCRKEEEKSYKIFQSKEKFFLNNTFNDFRKPRYNPNSENKKSNNNNNNNKNNNNNNNNNRGRRNNKDQYPSQQRNTRSRSRSDSKNRNQNRENNPQNQNNQRFNWPTPTEASNRPNPNKSRIRFERISRPNKQRKNEEFEICVIPQNKKTNANTGTITNTNNRNIIIVPDTQQSREENETSGENNFLFHGQGATNTNQSGQQQSTQKL